MGLYHAQKAEEQQEEDLKNLLDLPIDIYELSSPNEMLDANKKALALAIKGLPTRNQQVLALYYDEELNLKEIGKVLDLSESRISQLLSESMARLRSALKDWSTI